MAKIDPELLQRSRGEPTQAVEAIVTVQAEAARRFQEKPPQEVGSIEPVPYQRGIFKVRTTGAGLAALAQDPDIIEIVEDFEVRGLS